jgi:ribosome-associated translation inhibitor RaiA
VNDPEYINYLEKIGFYPEENIEGYKINFKLYDLCEQSLIYHLFEAKVKNQIINKSVLFLLFDEKVVNAAVFNEGAIISNFKGKKNYLNNININDENGVLNFLENANDTFEGIDLVLSCLDYKENNKKKLEELIEKIKKYCEEKIKVNVTVCDEKEINKNVFNYMNLFYKD